MNKKQIGILVVASALLGFLFYAWYNQILVIRLFTSKPLIHWHESHTKKVCAIFYPTSSGLKQESCDLVITDDMAAFMSTLLQRWITLLYEEHIILKKITIQSCMLDSNQHTAYLSCDRSLFASDNSITYKLMLLESLLKTLRENQIPITSIQLLVHHKPLQDIHIDCSRPFPITGYLSV